MEKHKYMLKKSNTDIDKFIASKLESGAEFISRDDFGDSELMVFYEPSETEENEA